MLRKKRQHCMSKPLRLTNKRVYQYMLPISLLDNYDAELINLDIEYESTSR